MKKQDKQERIEYLKLRINGSREAGIRGLLSQEVVQTYLKYEAMKPWQQQQLIDEWNDYFEKVQTTNAYKRYKAQSKAFKQVKTKLVKGFSDKAMEQIEKQDWGLVKPRLDDPLYISNHQDVVQYKSFRDELNKLMKIDDEFKAFGL